MTTPAGDQYVRQLLAEQARKATRKARAQRTAATVLLQMNLRSRGGRRS